MGHKRVDFVRNSRFQWITGVFPFKGTHSQSLSEHGDERSLKGSVDLTCPKKNGGRGIVFVLSCKLIFWTWLGSCILSCTSTPEKTSADQGQKEKFTYAEDVAPILFKHCLSCHRKGEAGPFTLLNYEETKRVGNRIKFAVTEGKMPPWPADPLFTHFVGERILSQQEKQAIVQWVDQGMPAGDLNKMPAIPVFQDSSYFGKPDLVLKLKEAVALKGNGTDAFLMLKYPYKLAKDTFVRFFEYVPHQRKLVHHVNGHLVQYDANRSFNYGGGKSCLPDARENFANFFEQMQLAYTDKKEPHFPALTANTVYYLPGYFPPVYPEGIGSWKMKKDGLVLLKNIHYGPSNKDVLDSSYINVFFAKHPPQRPVQEMQMGTFGVSEIEPKLIIPAGEIKSFVTQWKCPQTISMLSVNPHMHLLGKTFLAYAVSPSGDTIPLIRIPKWDFNWQYYYTFPHPVIIPGGSIIKVEGVFDNTASNPFNPFHPPREISEGVGNESMQTTEEMFQFIFTFMPYQQGDEALDLSKPFKK